MTTDTQHPCITCVQYRGGYHDTCGGMFSIVDGIMINVGDILSTVGVFGTVGGSRYHEYRGGLS